MSQVMVRWRDDGSATFKNEQMQEVNEYIDFLYFKTPGQYRTRQYEISYTDATPFTLIMAEEDVNVLDY